MAKKAELQEAYETYHELMRVARSHERAGLLEKAVDCALKAWDHVDGMMQYGRRWENEDFDSIEAIDLVLNYAPLTFDHRAIARLREMLKEQRRIERNTDSKMADAVDEAERLMWANHSLWNHLEWEPEAKQSDLRQRLGGEQNHWRQVSEAWERMGLIDRRGEGGSYCLSLATRLGAVVEGKCFRCGAIAEAPKAMFLEDSVCPHCGEKTPFLIRPSDKQSS